MEARFKKDMNSNYLILECEEKEHYEMQMILCNKIKGLLECKRNTFNGQTEIYYNISSKQPLSRIFLKKELGIEDIKRLLLSIRSLMDELKRYLLSIDYVLFDAEYCYCNPEIKQPEWIFYPYNNSENSMVKLAEFLIDKVDHGERAAVDLAYHFYKLVRNEMLTQAELDKLLDEYKESKKAEMFEQEKSDLGNEDAFQFTMQSEETICRETTPRNSAVWRKIKELLSFKILNINQLGKNALKKKIEYVNAVEWETYGLEKYPNYNGETVVMGVQSLKATRRLRCLSESDEKYISLKKLPCILGKMEECSDVILKDPSISRMHARIFEENGELYLQDLNSTNGSYINSLELESNEIVKLKIGDEITFGNLRYIYE